MTRVGVERYVPLVECTRGAMGGSRCVETLHLGAIAVVDGEGRLMSAVGEVEVPVHLRSTAKPFQLLPLLLDGIHERPLDRLVAFGRDKGKTYQITGEDLAVMMASHSGQAAHTGRVARLLSFGGLSASDLRCGTHAPVHAGTWETMLGGGQAASDLHNNCSGKHTNMLLTCVHNGYPLETYLEPDHPLQRRILHIIETFSGVSAESMGRGVDGCSAPTFVLPLVGLARMFARLASPSSAPLVEGRSAEEALRTLFASSTAHPFQIAGSGRLDTAVMRAFEGRVMAKIGAAGAYTMAIAPCAAWPDGLGVALKVLDGDQGGHIRPVVVAELLRQLGLYEGELPSALSEVVETQIPNHRALIVGERRACFGLTSEVQP